MTILRATIDPKNPTRMWFTVDAREPTEKDHDFSADFHYQDNEERVVESVLIINWLINHAAMVYTGP